MKRSIAPSFGILLIAAALVGTGSSIFHPESSRVARMASGGKHGLAQSLFQVGGNAGSALGPLLAAAIVLPRGLGSIRWFSLAALLAIVVLIRIGRWYKGTIARESQERPARLACACPAFRDDPTLSNVARTTDSSQRSIAPRVLLIGLLR